MELGRSAWIRRERLERIATAERDRRAGRTALAIAALGEAVEWPARAVLALTMLPADEGVHARRILEEGLDQWALECGLPSLDADASGADPQAALLGGGVGAAPAPGPEFRIELDRPIEPSELEQAFAEAEAQVEEMHDVNDVAAGVLFAGGFDPLDLAEDELDPLELSAREVMATTPSRAMDAAFVPEQVRRSSGGAGQEAIGEAASGSSRAFVLATLERWLENLERSRAERMR